MNIKKFNKDGVIERQGDAAGYDLASMEEVVLYPGESKLVKSGIGVSLPQGHLGLLTHRSSFPSKKGGQVILGIIDEDYRGEIRINCVNHSDTERVWVKQGDRIAQMIILEAKHFPLVEVDSLDETDRGEGGFGSTGE